MIAQYFHYQPLTVTTDYQYQSRRNARYGRYLQADTPHPTREAARLYDEYRRCLDRVTRLRHGFETFWTAHSFPGDETVPRYPQELTLSALRTLHGLYQRALPFAIR